MAEKIIEINIYEKRDFFDTFNHDELSEELSDYIVRQSKKIDFRDKIKLSITTKFGLDGDDKEIIEKVIKKHYKEKIDSLEIISKFNRERNLIVFLLGIIFVLVSFQLRHFNAYILDELFTVAGWVLLWETIYYIIFGNINKRVEKKIFKMIINSEVVFNKYERIII